MSQNIWEIKDTSLLNRQKRRAQLVTSYLKKSPIKRILDIGCAEGYTTKFISQTGAFIVGLELELENLKIAKYNLKHVEFVNASIDSLPFRAGCFDAVCILEVLEHLDIATQNKGLRETDLILSNGGNIIISVPYKEKIIQTKCIHCGKITPTYGHLRSLDKSDIDGMLPNHHYRLVETCRLPNLEFISCKNIFQSLPLPIWLLLNHVLGFVKKGYWIAIHYTKE